MAEQPLHFSTITEVAGLIKSKQLSPVEIATAVLQRIDQLDRRFKSYATVIAEAARMAAKKAEAEITSGTYHGPLHGIPVAVKDLCFTKGVPRWEVQKHSPITSRTSMPQSLQG